MKLQMKAPRLFIYLVVVNLIAITVRAEDVGGVFDSSLADIFPPGPRIIDLVDQGVIDQLDLGLVAPTERSLTLQAEEAFINNGRTLDRHPGFTGTGYVALKGEGSISWTFNIQKAGIYRLQFRYSLKRGNRPLVLPHELLGPAGTPFVSGQGSPVEASPRLLSS